jgi:Calcium binding
VKIPVMRRDAGKKRPQATKASDAELDALIEEATVDAYDESEQATGFYTMLEEHLEIPFKTEVLGVKITVEKLDLTDDNQIAVICTRGKSSQRIPILDLPLPRPPRRARNGSTPIADGDVGDSGGRTDRSSGRPRPSRWRGQAGASVPGRQRAKESCYEPSRLRSAFAAT